MFHPWPLLPLEMKLEALRHVLHSPGLITHAIHTQNLKTGQISTLLRTGNKELINLALDAYYKNNTFLIAPHNLHTTFGPRARMLRPRAATASKIQHLVFNLRIRCPRPSKLPGRPPAEAASLFFRQAHPFTFLFQLDERRQDEEWFKGYTPDGGVTKRTLWRRNFTALKMLALILILDVEHAYPARLDCVVGACRRREEIVRMLRCARTGLKARKEIEARVRVHGCRGGVCARKVEEILESILLDAEMGAREQYIW